MPLQYEPLFSLEIAQISSVGLSTFGTRLAAITSDCGLHIWDLATGKEYYPATGPVSSGGKSCILWLDDTKFVCGFEDGYFLTASLAPGGSTVDDFDLTLNKKKMADSAILTMSFEMETGLLAVGDEGGVRFWKLTVEATHDWEYRSDLPEPMKGCHDHHGGLVGVTSVEWIQPNMLLVAYSSIGIFIWDTVSYSVIRSFQTHSSRKIRSGTLCHGANKFVSVNDVNTIDVYDIKTGVAWSPEAFKNILSVKSIHKGTGFIAGMSGHAELVDIKRTAAWQSLRQDEHQSNEVIAVDSFCDKNEEVLMLVTVSPQKAVVWKAKEKRLPGLVSKDIDIDTNSSVWSSLFTLSFWRS